MSDLVQSPFKYSTNQHNKKVHHTRWKVQIVWKQSFFFSLHFSVVLLFSRNTVAVLLSHSQREVRNLQLLAFWEHTFLTGFMSSAIFGHARMGSVSRDKLVHASALFYGNTSSAVTVLPRRTQRYFPAVTSTGILQVLQFKSLEYTSHPRHPLRMFPINRLVSSYQVATSPSQNMWSENLLRIVQKKCNGKSQEKVCPRRTHRRFFVSLSILASWIKQNC